LGALLELCHPFAEGSVRRTRTVVRAGNGQRSIAIEVASPELNWNLTRDSLPLARAFVRLAEGSVSFFTTTPKLAWPPMSPGSSGPSRLLPKSDSCAPQR
jgi:hypothetical protein